MLTKNRGGGRSSPLQSFATRHPLRLSLNACHPEWREGSAFPSFLPSFLPSFTAAGPVFARTRINIIPLVFRFLCFHTLTRSFAPRNPSTLLPSIASALFPQTPGGGCPFASPFTIVIPSGTTEGSDPVGRDMLFPFSIRSSLAIALVTIAPHPGAIHV
jgi:hypothetical protein